MIYVKDNETSFEIRFRTFMEKDQFASCVERIKQIEGRKYQTVGKENYWTVPSSSKEQLEQLFQGKEIEWEEDAKTFAVVQKNISDDLTYIDELLLQPYPFQAIGINYLCDHAKCLLADEMGLGKTVQVLGATYKLFRQGKVKKALIVCPSSLKYQWAEEIEKFIDVEKYGIEYRVIDGVPKKRVETYDYVKDNDVLYTIINYELVLNDIDYLLEQDWDIVALDEGHRIKNWASKTSEAIMQLNAPKYTWAATGTPVQNRPDEVFNIFKFVNEKVLGNWWKFRSTHMIIGTKFKQTNMILGFKNLSLLHHKLSPHMLRRLKIDVAPELPEMLINNFYIDMYPEQAKLHDSLSSELMELIKEVSKFTERDENGTIIKQHPKANQILGMFTMLQEICDAPELLNMSDSKMAARYAIAKVKSPKIDELEIILKEFLDSYDINNVAEKYKGLGPKAVIFTQFARMQELIIRRIEKLGICKVINGSMNAQEKQQAVVDFKFDPNIRFLVCTDAANYGLNLGIASLLINVDLPWNPATYSQRNARIHRIDSEHDVVNIVNLVSKDGLDEKILDVLYEKQNMASVIVENREQERQYLTGLTNSVITKLLKKPKKK